MGSHCHVQVAGRVCSALPLLTFLSYVCHSTRLTVLESFISPPSIPYIARHADMEDFRGEIGWFEKELRAFEEDETDTIYFPRTETEWRREGPPISERRFHEYGGSVMAESSVEYAATQVVGESFVSEAVPRREAILRIWQEYVPLLYRCHFLTCFNRLCCA